MDLSYFSSLTSFPSFVTLALFFLTPTRAWKTYEDPVRIATPNADGVYEFDLMLLPKLSMSIPLERGEFHERSIIDYDPQNLAWLERNKDQLGPCIANRTLVSKSEVGRLGRSGYKHRTERVLAGLTQHLGTHVRLFTVNETTPGPTLVVPFGAEVLVRIRNRLILDSITLHMHGLDMNGAWFNDGVGYVQQCPIPPNSDYSFRFVADRVGTHWYHGEYPYHTASGILGAFIVLSQEEKFIDDESKDSDKKKINKQHGEYDRDYVVLLQDWPVSSSERQYEQFSRMTTRWAYEFDAGPSSASKLSYCLRPGELNGVPNYQSSPLLGVLINSKGWHSQRDIRSRPAQLPLTTYIVTKGDKVRLRVIHGGYDAPLFMHIEDHRLTIIASDGTPIKPIMVDKLMIYPGERYDVRVEITRRPTRKIYHVIVRTEDAYYQPDVNTSWIPYWSSEYAKPTHAPIYGLANLELADVAFDTDAEDVDFEQAPCKQATTKCVVLNCPYTYVPGNAHNFASLPIDRRRYICITVNELQRETNAHDRDVLGGGIHLSNFEEHFISVDPNSDVDGRIFVEPKRPLLYGDYNRYTLDCDEICGDLSSTIFKGLPCHCFTYKRFQRDNIVQITLYSMWQMMIRRKFTQFEKLNIVGRAVSFHLHGRHFYVVKMGFPTYNDNFTIAHMNSDLACTKNEIGCITKRWTNSTWHYGNIPNLNHQATLKDTVIVPYGGYVTIRFRAENPGWWLAETMNANYNDGGTKFAFAIGTEMEMPPAPDDLPQYCGVFDEPFFPK